MNKLFLAFCLTIVSSVFAFAQSDIKKAEFYVGYSNNQVDTNPGSTSGVTIQNFYKNRSGFNGFEVSGVANVSRYVGIKGDFSGAYKTINFNNVTVSSGTFSTNFAVKTKNSIYNFLGGVQIKDNSSKSKVKPFAHALVGLGYGRAEVTCSTASNATCSGFNNKASRNGLAGAFGGGLDVQLSDRIGVRVIQVDYNPVRFDGQTHSNFRIGAGIVF